MTSPKKRAHLGINWPARVSTGCRSELFCVAHFFLDGHIAAQEDRLRKQASDMLEMKEKLDEVLHKVFIL